MTTQIVTSVPDELVECPIHGPSPPAFVCVHLLDADGQGFYHGELDPDADESRPDAWCGACEERRVSTGGSWTEDNEPTIRLLCAVCWDRTRERNLTGREDS
jgi:hypothetical protein